MSVSIKCTHIIEYSARNKTIARLGLPHLGLTSSIINVKGGRREEVRLNSAYLGLFANLRLAIGQKSRFCFQEISTLVNYI